MMCHNNVKQLLATHRLVVVGLSRSREQTAAGAAPPCSGHPAQGTSLPVPAPVPASGLAPTLAPAPGSAPAVRPQRLCKGRHIDKGAVLGLQYELGGVLAKGMLQQGIGAACHRAAPRQAGVGGGMKRGRRAGASRSSTPHSCRQAGRAAQAWDATSKASAGRLLWGPSPACMLHIHQHDVSQLLCLLLRSRCQRVIVSAKHQELGCHTGGAAGGPQPGLACSIPRPTVVRFRQHPCRCGAEGAAACSVCEQWQEAGGYNLPVKFQG